MAKQIQQEFAQLLEQAQLSLLPATIKNLIRYIELLDKWNHAYNLTAIREQRDMLTWHLMDSLAIGPYLQGQRFVDVGTGPGLPGIPLALVYPEQEWTLVESNRKKCQFLLQAVLSLGIKNIKLVQERAEALVPETCFDAVVTRAFASLADMLTMTQHLCCPGGQFIAMKGEYPTAELDALPAGFKAIAVHPLSVVGLAAQRHVVVIEKNKVSSPLVG